MSFISLASFSQEFDNRLLKSYSESELQTIKSESPELIKVLNYALDNACYFSQINEGKDYSDLPSISLKSTSQLPGIDELGLKIEKQNQYYRIEGTDKLLFVKSEWVIQHELKNK